jgi:hypothetical protein
LPKKRIFDPHAAKAQNKKIWYLRDQQVVATTSQEDHPGEAQKATINPKDQHQPPKAKPLQTERKRNSPSQNQNPTKATGLATTNLKAVLGTAHHQATKNHHQDQNLIPDAHRAKAVSEMVHHQAIKNRFRHVANPTRAGQQAAAMMIGLKEILDQALLVAIENLTRAGQHQVMRVKDQKEVSEQAVRPATRNLIRLHAPEQLQNSKTDPKEALALNQPAIVNLMQVQNQENAQQIKNLAKGQPKADLKNAKVLRNTAAKDLHNVNPPTIK